jgi:hypothetical protein
MRREEIAADAEREAEAALMPPPPAPHEPIKLPAVTRAGATASAPAGKPAAAPGVRVER